MNCLRRFCAPALAALGMTTLFAGSAWVMGQTTPVAAIGTKMPSANFLSAPTFKLSDIPSGVVSTDLDGDGKPDLVVAFASAGKVVVYLGAGKGKFQAPVEYSVGGHPVALAAVDVNGDGQLDIVTANGADGTVSVLLGAAGGTLAKASILTVGVDANYLAAGDLNGDGSQDLVVASGKGQALVTFLSDGRGAMQAAVVQALGKTPTGLVLGDFNGDHHVDVAVVSDDGTVGVLLGGGDGTLQVGSSFSLPGGKILSVAAADFDRNGTLDLAVTQADGRLLTTFPGKGDGTFGTGTSYLVGNGPIFTAAIDVNGDGFVDLISVNHGSNTMSVLLGKGDGTFQDAKDFAVGDGPVAVAAGDFYSTGFTGLAVVDSAAKTLNAIAGKGDGTFRAAPSYSGDLSPRAVASGDLNGDGLPDIVVTNFCGSDAKCAKGGSLSVYLGQATGGYKLASTQVVGVGPVSVALADLNGDGLLDVLALNRGDKTLSVLLGVGDGTLQEPATTALVSSPVAVVAKDFNGDGKIDLAVVSDCGSAKCTQPGSVDVYFGGGDGSFRLGASYPVSYSPTSIAAGDLNGDSILDLVVANACGKDASCNSAGTATVLLGGTKGTFAPQTDTPLNNAPSSIALRGATSKAALDMVVAHEADNTVAVLKGNGDGTFNTPTAYAVGSSPRSIVIADLNGDGVPDVAVANAKDSTVSVLYGKADGTLVTGGSYAVAAGPEALTAVAGVGGLPASLVTANGNSASTFVGSEITSLLNASPNVGTAPSTTTITSVTPASPTVNTAVTIQATVLDGTTGLPVPDGESVSFSSDDVGVLSCTTTAVTASGVASCTTSQITSAVTTLTASYPGDVVYATSSGTQALTVTTAATMTAVTSSPAASTINQPVSFSTTITPSPTGPTMPQGMVVYTDSLTSGTLCTLTVAADGSVPSCNVTFSTLGTHTITATYNSSNGNFTGSSGTNAQVVTASATTTTVTSSPAASTVNQPVTFTAVVAPAFSGTTKPQGTVVFADSQAASPLCTVTLNPDGSVPVCMVSLATSGTHTVTATYTSADGNFSGSSGTDAQVVTATTTTTTVTSSPAASTVNQPVTFTAVVAPAFSGTTMPQGMVVFADSQATAPLCTVTLNADGSVPVCMVSLATLGTHTVTATYMSGDGNFAGSSGTDAQVVTASSTMTTVTSSPAASTINQPVTFTAVVAPSYSGTTKPQGMVVFVDGLTSTTLCTKTLAADGSVPACTVALSTLGTHTVTATYTSTDGNFTGSSGMDGQAVTASTTMTTVTSSPTASTVNQTVIFTAVVAPAYSGTTKPQGTVVFADSLATAPLCTKTLNADGTVPTCSTILGFVGSHVVTATYTSTSGSFTGSGGSDTQVVNATATSTSVGTSGSPTSVGQQVTFTAIVTSSVPGNTKPQGTLTFNDSLASAPVCTVMLAADGTVPSCMTNSLVAGTHIITGVFASTDGNFVTSMGNVQQVVTTTSTSLGISPNPASSSVNQPVTFTAVITPSFQSSTKPQGTVTFIDNLTHSVLCTQTVAPDGTVPACVTSFQSMGTRMVQATYASADSNFMGSSQTINYSVGTTSTMTAVTSMPTSSSVNQQVAFTATITPSVTGTAKPQGTVTFMDGSTLLCSVTVNADGTVPQCTSAFVTSGTHVVTASYSGNTNFTTSSGTDSQVVTAASTMTSITSSPSSSFVNQQVVFTTAIAPSFSGAAKPQGAVTLTDALTGSTICTVTVASDGSVPTCTTAFITGGTHAVTAMYASSSTATFGTSSGSDSQVVSPEATSTTVVSSYQTAAVPVDSPVIFKATVSKVTDSTYTGSALPAGTVAFTDGSTTLSGCGTVMVASDGTAPCTTMFSAATTQTTMHNITATYTPSTNPVNFQTSMASVAQVVSPAATSITLISAQPNSTVNQPVTFTATLSSPSVPTGTVTFIDLSTNTTLCMPPAQVPASGPLTFTCTYTFTAVGKGNHPIQVSYSGDTNFSPSSQTVPQMVSATSTSLSITPSITAAVVDQQVTFSIVLTPGVVGSTKPQGTVTLTDTLSSTPMCTPMVAADGSVPSCMINLLVPGKHIVTAMFAPADANFGPSSSSSVTIIVNAAATSVSILSTSPSSSVVNQPITFSATVTTPQAANNGLTTPTGTVTFQTGTTPICTATLTNGGTAVCTALLVPGTAGTYPINATFTPTGSNFSASSTTTAVNQIVGPGATTMSLTSSSQPVVATRSVTFTATLSVASPATSTPVPLVGSITFATGANGTQAANCASASSPTSTIMPGTAYLCSVTYSAGTSGGLQVTALFTPANGNFVTSTSNVLAQTVQDLALQFTTSTAAPFAGPVDVTQGSTNVNDPFTAVPSLAVVVLPISGFGDGITYACSLPSAAIGLSCAVTPGSGLTSQNVVLSASSTATLGNYVATVTATDSTAPALSRSMTVPVHVAGSVPTSLSPGVTGTINVPFAPPTPSNTFTFACQQIVLASTGKATTLLKCAPPANGNLTSGSAAFIISPNVQTSMALPPVRPSSRIFAATFLCVPLFGLAGYLGRRRSASRNFFRFLASIVVLAGIAQTIGCGGGFTVPVQTALTTTGSYLVQVTATDSTGTYYAVIPVTVQ